MHLWAARAIPNSPKLSHLARLAALIETCHSALGGGEAQLAGIVKYLHPRYYVRPPLGGLRNQLGERS